MPSPGKGLFRNKKAFLSVKKYKFKYFVPSSSFEIELKTTDIEKQNIQFEIQWNDTDKL